jgi:dTDP-4-amino-4,6-dideoxygalactose transaminase
MDTTPIPQTDPRAAYLARRDDFDAAWRRVMDSGRYILGPEVEAFEREFGDSLGLPPAVGVANGTDALHLALRCAGVAAGDWVFTVAHTAVATVTAVVLAGAAPAFVDIDPATYTLDPNRLEDAARLDRGAGRARAVVVVHLYGHPADMPAVLDVARRHDLRVIEDCAQCHGAELHGRKAGCWGDVAAFSFYPTKNLGTFGDGGAVASRDEAVLARCRRLREYGWDRERLSAEPGLNSRLDELHAALLRVRLRHLAADNEARRAIAAAYDARLRGSAVRTPAVRPGAVHVYHQYVVRSADRDALRAALRQRGIGTLVHYAPPAHRHPAFRPYHDPGRPLGETERAAAEVLSLPMYPQLAAEDVGRVADAVAAWGR